MQVVLQGNLKQFPLSQVLTLFGEHEHSGTLDIESGSHRARVFLSDGKVIYAESSDNSAGNAGEAVVRTFEWPEGKFTFLDDVVLPDKASRVSLDVGSIIAEAMKRRENGYADYAMFRVIDNPDAQQQISVSPEEFKLLFRIGQGKTFGDLSNEPNVKARDLGQKLKSLEKAGLILRVDQPASQNYQGSGQNYDATVIGGDLSTQAAPAPMEASEPAPMLSTRTQEEPMGGGDGGGGSTSEATVFVAKPKREDMMAAAAAAGGDATLFAPPPSAPPAEAPPMENERTQAGTTPVPDVPVEAPKRAPGGTVFGSLTPDSGDTHPLIDSEYSVGRDDSNDISIRDGSVSAKHARIIRNDEGFWVEDIGSRNGTFVNGEKVTEKRLLSNGDLVRFGKVILTYHIAEESGSDQTVDVRSGG